jgi:hypothetical protein
LQSKTFSFLSHLWLSYACFFTFGDINKQAQIEACFYLTKGEIKAISCKAKPFSSYLDFYLLLLPSYLTKGEIEASKR